MRKSDELQDGCMARARGATIGGKKYEAWLPTEENPGKVR